MPSPMPTSLPASPSDAAARRRQANDTLRRTGAFGPGTDTPLFVTPGVQALGADAVASLVLAVMQHETFTDDLDPDGLHEMGEVRFFGTHVLFAIEPRPTPARPDGSSIVLLLSSEY